MLAGLEAKSAMMNHEHLGGFVTVLRIGTARRLPRTADIEAVRNADVYVLFRVLGNAGADDGEVLFAIAARRVRVDECIGAGSQLGITHQTLTHGLGSHVLTRLPRHSRSLAIRAPAVSVANFA